MPCYSPLQAFRSRYRNASGKVGIVFSAKDGWVDQPVTVACGQCIGCRLERSRQWAVRCVHEASLYADNCFVTLTYSDLHCPPSQSLIKDDFQRFMKRLRKRFGSGVRYFHCGEYGEQFGRPHYHACLFNHDFPDKVPYKVSDGGVRTYTSEILEDIWGLGFCVIGSVTFESAAYVARYLLKKVTGEAAVDHYTFIDVNTGEFYERLPEYTTMSRRPGIGHNWVTKYRAEVYPDDFVISRGFKVKPPKYYDRQFELCAPKDYAKIVHARKVRGIKRKDDSTPERLAVRERVTRAKVNRLKREVD